jgi:hypothetical protein
MKTGFEQLLGIRKRPGCLCHLCRDGDDPRLKPVRGDWIDELVNESLARGKTK